LLAAAPPEAIELALVLADSLPPPTALLFLPNVLLTKMGVSYLTSENPLLYICLLFFFDCNG
jgi:hypothetical protein